MSGSSSSNPAGDTERTPAAEPLQLAVHAMPGLDLRADAATRRTARGRWQLLLVVLACAAPVLASYFTYYVIRPEGRSNYAALIEPARELPRDGGAAGQRTRRGPARRVIVSSPGPGR